MLAEGGVIDINCKLCPRLCDINRNTTRGFCGENEAIRVTRAAPHYWEEPCISGTKGSGTVFFAGCNLKCVYCQNSLISRGQYGKTVTVQRLAEIFLELQAKGVHNINLVTPSHFTLQIAEAIKVAKAKGLTLPIVWNSSAYENVSTLKALDGLVDIYLPDYKYRSADLAKRYSAAEDYPMLAESALDEMVRQCGEPKLEDGIMTHGIIVRHLVLPGCIEDSKNVLYFLQRKYGNNIYISIMRQYTPISDTLPDSLFRKVSDSEYESVVRFAARLGINNGYIQEGDAANESFIPPFDMTGV